MLILFENSDDENEILKIQYHVTRSGVMIHVALKLMYKKVNEVLLLES